MAYNTITQSVRRSLQIALIFQVAWVITGLLFTVFGANVGWGLLLANLLTLWAPAAYIFITRTNLSDGFQIGFGVFITASSLIGSALSGYAVIPNWDTIVHIYSGTLLAWFGFVIATNAELSIKRALPIWFKNAVAVMTPLAFASVWEIYEFMSDTYIGTTMQAGGLEDTIIDMIAALLGAVIAVVASSIWFWYHAKQLK